MSVLIIGDSSKLYMPYLRNYEYILKNNDKNYELLYWDRFNIDEQNDLVYTDKKRSHKRNFLDYYKFVLFIKRKIKNKNYEKIIVFGLPCAILLGRYLKKNYKNKYIIDVRDYHKLLMVKSIDRIFEKSYAIVLSSPGYKIWLPNFKNYIINHNAIIKNRNELKKFNVSTVKQEVKIAFIGATRDFEINMQLINSLANNPRFVIKFHGHGDINKKITEELKKSNINNVLLTGKYIKQDEEFLYKNSDLINVLRFSDSINNKTALPNRLYNSIIYGKPMLAFKGTYLAEIIEQFNLGLIIDTFENVSDNIFIYLESFDQNKFNAGRQAFIDKVIDDNNTFEIMVTDFIN